jgi:hypothetical protein
MPWLSANYGTLRTGANSFGPAPLSAINKYLKRGENMTKRTMTTFVVFMVLLVGWIA